MGPDRLRLASRCNQNLAGLTAGTITATAGTKGRDRSKVRRLSDRRVEEPTRRPIRTEAQSEGKDECDEEPWGIALHEASPARACCKLRSLFISANSRKPDCSSCQAATPSRVAASASLGT